jgi:hypothetical protein
MKTTWWGFSAVTLITPYYFGVVKGDVIELSARDRAEPCRKASVITKWSIRPDACSEHADRPGASSPRGDSQIPLDHFVLILGAATSFRQRVAHTEDPFPRDELDSKLLLMACESTMSLGALTSQS